MRKEASDRQTSLISDRVERLRSRIQRGKMRLFLGQINRRRFCRASSSRNHSIDDYVVNVLMRDIVGHDRQQPRIFVYLHLYGRAAAREWETSSGELRRSGRNRLSKSAIQSRSNSCAAVIDRERERRTPTSSDSSRVASLARR